MVKELTHLNEKKAEPIYGAIWRQLKRFPNGLANGAKKTPTVSGPAAATLMSVSIGCLTMMITHHLSDTSKDREAFIKILGAWIPGSHNPSPIEGNIGSYAGKETMLLVGWIVSWIILHVLWKNKNIKGQTIFFWFFAVMLAATVMAWHPAFPYLPLM